MHAPSFFPSERSQRLVAFWRLQSFAISLWPCRPSVAASSFPHFVLLSGTPSIQTFLVSLALWGRERKNHPSGNPPKAESTGCLFCSSAPLTTTTRSHEQSWTMLVWGQGIADKVKWLLDFHCVPPVLHFWECGNLLTGFWGSHQAILVRILIHLPYLLKYCLLFHFFSFPPP